MSDARWLSGADRAGRVVGAGLLGTSIGLACARRGHRGRAARRHADNLRTASGLGAGQRRRPTRRPPAARRGRRAARPPRRRDRGAGADAARDAVVTDVGSVKSRPAGRVAGLRPAPARYVGSHPMAGSERSGPLAATAALFDGRPWAVTPHAAVRRRRPSTLVDGAGPRVRRGAGADDAPRSTTGPWPAPPTCRTCWPPSAAGRLTDAPRGAPGAVRPGRARRHPRRRRRPRALAADRRRPTPTAVARLLGEVRDARSTTLHRGPGRGTAPGWSEVLAQRRRRHRGHPRQARRPGRATAARCSSPCPTTRASWPGCSPTPATARSTSRTSGSTTTRAGRSAWSSCVVAERPRRAPAGLARSPGLGRPTGRLAPREQHRSRPRGLRRGPGRRRRRHLRVGQVEHLPRRRRPARPALPRHRRACSAR